jgi:pyruvate dehydrogenase E1 component alpha subunit
MNATRTGAKPPARRTAKKTAAADAQWLAFFREMLLIRRFEEKAGQLYGRA